VEEEAAAATENALQILPGGARVRQAAAVAGLEATIALCDYIDV
jgi:hypothetical protein